MIQGFKEQLDDFFKDTSHFEKYKNVEIRGYNTLIEVFKFKTRDGNYGDSNKDTPTILLVNPLGGQVTTNKDFYVDYTHVAKVISVGDKVEGYKPGDCVLLNPFEVTKEARNPQWVHYMEYQNAKGMEPIIPDDMREFIPSVQAYFVDYQFVLPEDYKKKVQDINTFIIPESKIKAIYKR